MTFGPKRFLEHVHISDGAYGTMFALRGLDPEKISEVLNLYSPLTVRQLQIDYIESGADLITTNTFNANPFRLKHYGLGGKLREIIKAGAGIAEEARKVSKKDVIICGSIGPSGEFLKPFGETEFDALYRGYSETVKAFDGTACDMLIIETITDLLEMKALLLAVKDNTEKPVIAQMSFNGASTVTGTRGDAFAVMAAALGADVIGLNCGADNDELIVPLKKILENTDLPVIVQANAGIPRIEEGKIRYGISPEEYARAAELYFNAGANIIGSCCGSTPEFTKEIAKSVKGLSPKARKFRKGYVISDRISSYAFGKGRPLLIIGEKLNSITNKRLKAAESGGDHSVLKQDAFSQAEAGAKALDINLDGLKPSSTTVADIMYAVQNTVDRPLVIDSVSSGIFTEALPYIAGKPIVNSVYFKKGKIEKTAPLLKRYGCSVILLSMDEEGVVFDTGRRLKAFEKGYDTLISLGIDPSDIIADPIVTPIASNPEGSKVTLQMIDELSKRGIATVIGLSNISTGMPARARINGGFLKEAMEAGLSAAIMNPSDLKFAVEGGAAELVREPEKRMGSFIREFSGTKDEIEEEPKTPEENLRRCISLGIADGIEKHIEELIQSGMKAVDIIENMLIPEIRRTGERFERQEVFLPQLIASAKAMQKASHMLKPYLKNKDGTKKKGRILLATVKGDIHDIGKTLVGIIFEGYGIEVVDAGKDADKEKILELYRKDNCDMIGLSVLMTSTLSALEETVGYLRSSGIGSPILIGGAVLNEEIGKKLGCIYCKDAISGVKAVLELSR